VNFSLSALAAGFIFGVFGLYFIKQGKRNADIPPILVGVALLVYPYFVENVFLLWGIGVALLVLGFRLVF
jgi:cytochrome c-type biogenesis protein CcmH/NrfF